MSTKFWSEFQSIREAQQVDHSLIQQMYDHMMGPPLDVVDYGIQSPSVNIGRGSPSTRGTPGHGLAEPN